MLKKISLRTRLTMLSALVMIAVAITLTTFSLISANQIFVRDMSSMLSNDSQNSFQIGDGSMDASNLPPAGYTVVPLELSKAKLKFNVWGVTSLVLMTILGVSATWIIVGRALRPLKELTTVIEKIDSHELSKRVDTYGKQDEIGRLAQSFNTMMDKVSSSFERQKLFSASAAHELKTPLATIQVGLEVLDLDDEPDPKRMKKALNVTKVNTTRMIHMMNDLFQLSCDEAYEMEDEVPVKELCDEVLTELMPLLQKKSLTTTISQFPEIILIGNRTLLYRVIFNLIENAAKYNREGGTILLSANQDDQGIEVRISDTGMGIPDEELLYIFEPFYRVDRSRSRTMGGTGLGLSLVKDIVEKHGGNIQVTSICGEGTTFTLRFPQAI